MPPSVPLEGDEDNDDNEVITGGSGHNGGARGPHAGAGGPLMMVKAHMMAKKNRAMMTTLTKCLMIQQADHEVTENLELAMDPKDPNYL